MSGRLTIVGITVGAMALAGCATSFGAKAKESDAIKTQVASVESQVGTMNQRLEEISNRQEALESEWQSLKQSRVASATKSGGQVSPSKKSAATLSARQIQLALKSAGFYTGPIDGKLGSQTREAVKTFQRSNHLTPDGVIGTKTSVALARYLENKSE